MHGNLSREIPAGTGLLGRVINFSGEPLDEAGPLSSTGRITINTAPQAANYSYSRPKFLETGLKSVDLLAPLMAYGITGLFSEPGAGKQVVIGEILYHLIQHRDAIMIFAGLEERLISMNDSLNPWKELGVSNKTVAVMGKTQNESEVAGQVVLTALNLAEYFRDQANRVVILYIDNQLAEAGNLVAYKDRLKQVSGSSIITFLGEPSNPEPGQSSAGLALDSWITFDRALAAQAIYPAIDSQRSGSRLLQPETVSLEHFETAQEVLEYLASYYDLMQKQTAGQISQHSMLPSQLKIQARGRRLQLFLSQPLFVAESFTGLPGEYVKIEDNLKGCRGILAGYYDHLPEKVFNFSGSMEDVLEKAARLK